MLDTECDSQDRYSAEGAKFLLQHATEQLRVADTWPHLQLAQELGFTLAEFQHMLASYDSAESATSDGIAGLDLQMALALVVPRFEDPATFKALQIFLEEEGSNITGNHEGVNLAGFLRLIHLDRETPFMPVPKKLSTEATNFKNLNFTRMFNPRSR
eukprot:NODE_12283_length_1234_cov_6.823848.p2 GENE.NODE_12283_length_1234_cov_6.823848~~NODE_12283_length_1234_cov_6.823848.p2  ORF type:complete len:157 (-),score=45.93 NODE_12283_length_1234_cov_6.823848:97-567(-)